jgi:hypothetical protein
MPSTHMTCRHLGNVQVCLGNTRAMLHAITAKPFFISMAYGLWATMGHMVAPDPSLVEV